MELFNRVEKVCTVRAPTSLDKKIYNHRNTFY